MALKLVSVTAWGITVYIGPIITVIVYIRRSRSKVDCRLHLRETWIGRKLPRRLSERSVREYR